MAKFKGMDHSDDATERVSWDDNIRPLFEDFDHQTQGGLVVLADGIIAEIMPPNWAIGHKDLEDRISTLPLKYLGNGEYEWLPENPWEPERPTMGSEVEMVMMQRGGDWHEISADGNTLQLPDGTTAKLDDHYLDLQPEAAKIMLEYKTDIAYGFEDHRCHVITAASAHEYWQQQNNLLAPGISVLPDQFKYKDLSENDWIQLVIEPDKLRYVLEFGCISEQMHVQIKTPEAAMYALNTYQGIQAIFGLITACSPIRDGQFVTTIYQHYRQNLPKGYEKMIADDDLLLSPDVANHVPYDWRELSREFGSPSSGVFANAAPHDIDTFLRMANKQLVNGQNVSAVRALGMHSDRLRLDKNTLEICNLGRTGGNLHKSLAVQELVSKFLVALQEYHDNPDATFDPQFAGIISQYDTPEDRETTCERGHANNIFMAISGKDTPLLGADGKAYDPADLLRQTVTFTDIYSPSKVDKASVAELIATLTDPPHVAALSSVNQVFDYFYTPGSNMTGTEALRYANEINPQSSVKELLQKFALRRRQHVFELSNNQQ